MAEVLAVVFCLGLAAGTCIAAIASGIAEAVHESARRRVRR